MFVMLIMLTALCLLSGLQVFLANFTVFTKHRLKCVLLSNGPGPLGHTDQF